MPPDYRVAIDLEALENLPKSGSRRQQVLLFLRGLSSLAHLGGDIQFEDAIAMRPYQVSVVAGFAITWWIDTPVNHVRVVDVQPAS